MTDDFLFPWQTADQLLARADAAKALAEEAAKKGQSTFREAESILEDLRGTTPPPPPTQLPRSGVRVSLPPFSEPHPPPLPHGLSPHRL